MSRTDERREALMVLAQRLAGDELEVLLYVAGRLDGGRARYGRLDLERDQRDFRQEALEELADAVVYLTAAMLRAGGGLSGAGRRLAGTSGAATAAAEGQGTPAPAERLGTPGNAYATPRCARCSAELTTQRRAVYCGPGCRVAAWKARRAARVVPAPEDARG